MGIASALVLLLMTGRVGALPGSHGMAVSSWDTTLSTVAFTYDHGIMSNGHLLITGYNANFTSTTGKLSSQFGLHYLNYLPEGGARDSHGISGTAIAVYGVPVADRYDNGLPKAAFTFFFGGAPAALIGGQLNYLTIAIPLGLAIPFSPSRHLTIAPWVELAPSINFDSVITGYSGTDLVDPETEEVPSELTPEQVESIIADSVEMDVSVSARFRGGVGFAFHLGDKVDLSVNATVGHVGSSFKEGFTFFVGGALVFGWDDPPSAVLPPAEPSFDRADCPSIYKRFKRCPYYKRFIQKIEDATLAECPQPEVECPSPEPEPAPAEGDGIVDPFQVEPPPPADD
jgi:hypothetical protein